MYATLLNSGHAHRYPTLVVSSNDKLMFGFISMESFIWGVGGGQRAVVQGVWGLDGVVGIVLIPTRRATSQSPSGDGGGDPISISSCFFPYPSPSRGIGHRFFRPPTFYSVCCRVSAAYKDGTKRTCMVANDTRTSLLTQRTAKKTLYGKKNLELM